MNENPKRFRRDLKIGFDLLIFQVWKLDETIEATGSNLPK